MVSGFPRNEFNSCILFNFCCYFTYFYLMLRLRGISSLFYFYNCCSKFNFVDFIVIFNLIMLKFYFFFCLFFVDLIFLLECFLYLCLCGNYCVISKLCLVQYCRTILSVNFFLGIRQRLHVRLFNKNIFSCQFLKYSLPTDVRLKGRGILTVQRQHNHQFFNCDLV